MRDCEKLRQDNVRGPWFVPADTDHCVFCTRGWESPSVGIGRVGGNARSLREGQLCGEAPRADILTVKVWRTNGDAEGWVRGVADGRILRSRCALRIQCPGERDDADDPGEEAHSLQLSAELLEILMATTTRGF